MATTTQTTRITRWTNEGTTSHPKIIDIYLRADGRYDVVTHYAGAYIGTDTQDAFPTAADLVSWGVKGRLRKVAM